MSTPETQSMLYNEKMVALIRQLEDGDVSDRDEATLDALFPGNIDKKSIFESFDGKTQFWILRLTRITLPQLNDLARYINEVQNPEMVGLSRNSMNVL